MSAPAKALRATVPTYERATGPRKTSRNWKAVQPTSLREAIEWCKDYARETRNLSVDRIADLMGISDKWVIYKFIQSGRLPANLIRPYEVACGIDFVSRWIAASAGKLLVTIPTGRKLKSNDVATLHSSFSAALQLLTNLYDGKADQAEVLAALTEHLVQVAWHRENIGLHAEPELDFGG